MTAFRFCINQNDIEIDCKKGTPLEGHFRTPGSIRVRDWSVIGPINAADRWARSV